MSNPQKIAMGTHNHWEPRAPEGRRGAPTAAVFNSLNLLRPQELKKKNRLWSSLAEGLVVERVAFFRHNIVAALALTAAPCKGPVVSGQGAMDLDQPEARTPTPRWGSLTPMPGREAHPGCRAVWFGAAAVDIRSLGRSKSRRKTRRFSKESTMFFEPKVNFFSLQMRSGWRRRSGKIFGKTKHSGPKMGRADSGWTLFSECPGRFFFLQLRSFCRAWAPCRVPLDSLVCLGQRDDRPRALAVPLTKRDNRGHSTSPWLRLKLSRPLLSKKKHPGPAGPLHRDPHQHPMQKEN